MTELAWLLSGGAVAAVLFVTAGEATRHRDRPGAVPFVFMLVGLGTLALIIPLYPVGVLPEESDVVLTLTVLAGYCFVALAWTAFAAAFTGRGPALTRGRGAGLAVLGGLAVLNTLVNMRLAGTLQQLSFVTTSVLQLSVVVLAVSGLFVAARSAIVYGDLPTGQAVAFVGGGILVTLLVLPLSVMTVSDRTALLAVMLVQLGAAAALFLFVQLRYDLLANPPIAGHLAREAILDTMSDAVVVVDREHRVLDANRAAERTFGIDRGGASGRSIAETVGIEVPAEPRDPLTIETTTGRRQFEVRRRSLSDSRGTLVGYAYRLRDVTDRQTREQRLEVLNRVLRHNLRNDLDAIRGFAEQLRATDAGADLDAARLAGTIRRTATDLAELGATVERADRIHSQGPPERTRIELVELAESVAADAEDGTVTVRPESGTVGLTTDGAVLRTVLAELVNNAIEHSDSDDPAVEIALETTDDGASIEVRDTGPGIPDREQTVLLEGEETPLQHGSGVGLWLVHWGVTRLGGTLSFTENDPRGSIVGLHIPSQDHPTPEQSTTPGLS